MDSAYFCEKVLQAAWERGFIVVGRVKHNQRLTGGSQIKEVWLGRIGKLKGMDFTLQFSLGISPGDT